MVRRFWLRLGKNSRFGRSLMKYYMTFGIEQSTRKEKTLKVPSITQGAFLEMLKIIENVSLEFSPPNSRNSNFEKLTFFGKMLLFE